MKKPEKPNVVIRRPQRGETIVSEHSVQDSLRDVPKELIDGVLLSSFVHQVVNPLGGIVGTLHNLIEQEGMPESKKKQKIKAAKAQLQHTIEMVRNLAFLANLDSKEGIASLMSHAAEVSIQKVAIEAIQFFQDIATKKNLKIHFHDSDVQFLIQAHEELLKHVFINLIDNAVKYADPGSEVSIESHIQKGTNTLIVSVTNIGDGFQDSEKEKIFEIGFRGQSAKEKKASGSGIGLFICRRIIHEIHKGSLDGEHSTKLRKTTFRIRLQTYKQGQKFEKAR